LLRSVHPELGKVIDMKDSLRALFYQLFAPSPLPLLQRALELSVSAAGLLSAYAFGRRSQQRHRAMIITK
jgi:hypothetical protein